MKMRSIGLCLTLAGLLSATNLAAEPWGKRIFTHTNTGSLDDIHHQDRALVIDDGVYYYSPFVEVYEQSGTKLSIKQLRVGQWLAYERQSNFKGKPITKIWVLSRKQKLPNND